MTTFEFSFFSRLLAPSFPSAPMQHLNHASLNSKAAAAASQFLRGTTSILHPAPLEV
jgi:hypothetical protein